MRRLLPLFFILLSICSKADYVWNEKCLQAYDQAMRLNFKRASEIISIEKKTNPKNLVTLYIESQMDFLRTFISENQQDLDALKTGNADRISQLENNSLKSPYQQLFIAEMYLQMAIGRLKFEEYLGAAYDTRKAYKILEDNDKAYPDFKPNKRGLGFVHAVVGSIPKNYSWAMNLLGLRGTIDQGLGELKQLLADTYKQNELSYLKDETIVMLTFLEMNLGKKRDDEAIRKRFATISDLDEKPLMQFAKCIYHFSNGENDSVINILSNRKINPDALDLQYLTFMEASARLHNLDFTSETLFLKYINNYKGNSYILSGWQRIAWIKLLQGNETGYKQCMSKCLEIKKGEDFSDEDKQAVADAKSGEVPNILLLRSRLLFDGGYYDRAIAELAGKKLSLFPRQKDKLELNYRLARIFDKQNKKEKAIQFYQQTLKDGEKQKFYFAANSALMIAQIYEEQENKPKAIEYYKKTLSMRDHDYQNSIDQKAKAGLNRLGE